MKITIDTKEESNEELKGIIAFLQQLVDGTQHTAPVVQSQQPAAPFETFGMSGFFDDPPKAQQHQVTPDPIIPMMDMLIPLSEEKKPTLETTFNPWQKPIVSQEPVKPKPRIEVY